MSDDTSPFAKLSQEVTEAILEATLDRTPSLNLKQLLKAQLVSRLIFRYVILTHHTQGRAFLLALRANPSYGNPVRTLTIKADQGHRVPDDLAADDVIRMCPRLVSLDCAISPFGPLSDGRAPLVVFPQSLKHYRVTTTAHEMENDGEEEDEEDSGDEPPAGLARLNELPSTVDSLVLESPKNPLHSSISIARAPFLHLLRIHFLAGLRLEEIVAAVVSGERTRLNQLDLTGVFPSQVPEDWMGSLLDKLIAGCDQHGIELGFNGRSVGSSPGGWWNAVTDHATERGER